jgi:hypothetical protein
MTKLSDDPNFNGSWVADGIEYILGGMVVSVLNGETRNLPPFPGRFLCFSPDKQSLVSFSYEPPSPEITLHQVDLASGVDELLTVKRKDQQWLTDTSHLVPGTLESAHIWQAMHLPWRKSAVGRYQLAFEHERTEDQLRKRKEE